MELTKQQKQALALAAARKRAKGGAGATDPMAPKMTVQPDLGFVPLVGPMLRSVGYDGIPKAPQAGYEPSSMPLLDPISTYANRTVEAIPMIGKPIADFARGVEEKVYGEAQGTRQQIETGNAAQFPVAALAGDITGTVAPFVAGGAVPIGARLLGMTGTTAARMGAGSVSAGTIEFLDSLSRGEDAGKAFSDAGWAAGFGGALPLVQKVAGMVVKAVTGKALEPAEAALAKALEADGIRLEDIAQRMEELGPEAVMADLGPNLQRLTGSLASLPGPAQSLVRRALGSRAERTNARIISDTDEILGPAPVPSQVDAGIQQNMDALAPEYQSLFRENARRVDTSGLAENLDSEIVNLRGDAQRAVRQVRGMLDIEGAAGNLDPNPYTLFQTRQAIDGLLETEANTKVIAALTRARQQVDGMLADAVPGLKQVDAKFEELARQRTALGRGQQTLDSGRTAIRPAELQDEVTRGAVPERGIGPSAVPFRLSQGARAEIERIIGTTANDLNALKTALKGDGSWNRDRLVTLFGAQKSDRLLEVLEREKTFDATNRIVTQNSETAARTAMQREVEHVDPQVSSTTLTGLFMAGGQKLANTGARFRRTGTNSQIAEALIGRGQFTDARYRAIQDALMERARKSPLSPAAVSQLLMAGGGGGF